MPSLAGAITTLGLAGLSVAAPVFDADYAAPTNPRPYTQTFTKLGLTASPAPYAIDFSGKSTSTTANVSGTDVWFVSWLEADIDSQQIETTDTWRVVWTEVSNLARRIEATDAWSVTWSESVALGISGVTAKAGTDTWSASWTESTTLNVSIDATEAWAVSWSEAGVVAVSVEQIEGVDTWTVGWSEDVLLDVFTGEIPKSADDVWSVSWTESGVVLARTPVDPFRIRIIPRTARIRIIPL